MSIFSVVVVVTEHRYVLFSDVCVSVCVKYKLL